MYNNIITIGNNKNAVDILKLAALAPMAGVADRAYRRLAVEYGASYVVSELISSKGISYNDEKSKKLLYVSEEERPMAVQLFGDDPIIMAKAAITALSYKPNIIDINMGCPVKKVAGNGCGCALMRDVNLSCNIIKEIKKVVDIPVTAKIRKGHNDDINATEFSKALEQAGVDAITIHGRTKEQMYKPYSDIEIIKAVKAAVKIPVIGNGDVDSVESLIKMYEYTNCDLVMIGRATYGNPYLFKQIKHYFETDKILPTQTIEEKIETMLNHIALICEYVGENHGIKEARKHVAWYLKGIHGAAKLRNACATLNTYNDILNLANIVLNSNLVNNY